MIIKYQQCSFTKTMGRERTLTRLCLMRVYNVCPDQSVRKLRVITALGLLEQLHLSLLGCRVWNKQRIFTVRFYITTTAGTVKILKFGMPENLCNHPKSLTRWLFLRVMHPKDAEGIANSVDPDQTAPIGAV